MGVLLFILGFLKPIGSFFTSLIGIIAKYWQLALGVLVIGFLAWTVLHTIPKLQGELQAQKTKTAEITTSYNNLRTDFDTYKVNEAALIANIGTQTTIIKTQERVREAIHDVPVTIKADDKPFIDPGMLERARRLRDYQQSSPVYQNQ